MYIRIVTFGLQGMDADQYQGQAAGLAAAFARWPGLLAKYWLADSRRETFGGVYVFDSREAADRSRDTDLFAGLTQNATFTDVTIREFDTLPEPTRVTTSIALVAE
jgi:hypothetical protein